MATKNKTTQKPEVTPTVVSEIKPEAKTEAIPQPKPKAVKKKAAKKKPATVKPAKGKAPETTQAIYDDECEQKKRERKNEQGDNAW